MYALKKLIQNSPNSMQGKKIQEGDLLDALRQGRAPIHEHFSKQNFSPSEQEDRWIPNLE